MEELDGYEFDFRLGSSFKSLIESPSPGLPAIFLAGVDEAGRGPLAGPVVAAAVILPPNPRIIGLRDSKIVPPEQREALYCEIQETALAVEVAVIEHDVIDSLNILEATMLAMRRCVQALSIKPHLVVIDGNRKPNTGSRFAGVVFEGCLQKLYSHAIVWPVFSPH
jgi:ribonuclease HII